MKALCVSMLLLMSQGVASESCEHRPRSHHVFLEEIPSDFKDFLNTIGFSTEGKSVEEIKRDYATWIAVQENQDRFLAEISSRMIGDREALSNEEQNALESLRNAFRLWSKTLQSEAVILKKPSRSSFKMSVLALNCSRPNCHCCRETHSLQEEIDAMRDEIADLKKEAWDDLVQSGYELAGATVGALSEQPLIAIGGVYYASKHLIESNDTYIEAIKLEIRVDDLERFAYDEGAIDECKSDKHWWKFWK